MEYRDVDVAIIGTGTAGMGAYRTARESTDKIALIEGGPYGTTCARVGCMPSKLLIAAADMAEHTRNLDPFGLSIEGKLVIDREKVMDRVRRERDRFVGFVNESVEGFEEKHKIRGYAHFMNDHTLIVDDRMEIQAKTFVLATGSAPVIPEILYGLGDRVVVNDHVFDWETLPDSVAVFGPGVIGLELGQAMHRLGVDTTVFGRGGRIGIFTDPAIKQYAREFFRKDMDLQDSATVQNMEKVENGVKVTFLDNEGIPRTEHYDYILAATGRKPNLDRLCLENTGLRLNERGVPFYNPLTLQCDPGHIFIAGDVNGDLQLLHEASDEGRIAGRNAGTYPEVANGHRRSPISVVFTEPQMATVGQTYHELNTRGEDFVTGMVSFENQGRSRVMLVNHGMMHIYARRSDGRFLGAEILGPRAENLAHLLSWSHQQGMTIPAMLDMPFYHPVIEEGLRTALRHAGSQL